MNKKLNTKGYIIEDDYDGDSDNYHRNIIRHPNGKTVKRGIYDCDLNEVLSNLPDVSEWSVRSDRNKDKMEFLDQDNPNKDAQKALVFVMKPKNGDTKHPCYEGGCPFYSTTSDGDMGAICKALWSTSPSGKNSLASLCNYYDVKNLIIAEVNENVSISEILDRDKISIIQDL
jgi:hypothetical protein